MLLWTKWDYWLLFFLWIWITSFINLLILSFIFVSLILSVYMLVSIAIIFVCLNSCFFSFTTCVFLFDSFLSFLLSFFLSYILFFSFFLTHIRYLFHPFNRYFQEWYRDDLLSMLSILDVKTNNTTHIFFTSVLTLQGSCTQSLDWTFPLVGDQVDPPNNLCPFHNPDLMYILLLSIDTCQVLNFIYVTTSSPFRFMSLIHYMELYEIELGSLITKK